MKRDRSQGIVIRDHKILMVKHNMHGRIFYGLPGGGIEPGETPEEATIRELKEECNVDGKIVRPSSIQFKPDNKGEIYTFLVVIPSDQNPSIGIDPENEEQTIVDVLWMRLDEISEKDRTYLWAAGLSRVEEYYEEIFTWGNSLSYPKLAYKHGR